MYPLQQRVGQHTRTRVGDTGVVETQHPQLREVARACQCIEQRVQTRCIDDVAADVDHLHMREVVPVQQCIGQGAHAFGADEAASEVQCLELHKVCPALQRIGQYGDGVVVDVVPAQVQHAKSREASSVQQCVDQCTRALGNGRHVLSMRYCAVRKPHRIDPTELAMRPAYMVAHHTARLELDHVVAEIKRLELRKHRLVPQHTGQHDPDRGGYTALAEPEDP